MAAPGSQVPYSAVAELIVHGRFRSLDLTNLLYARIAEGRPVKEQNVV